MSQQSSYSHFYANLKSDAGKPIRQILETFVRQHIRSKQLYGKDRQHQSDLIQELMVSMTQ